MIIILISFFDLENVAVILCVCVYWKTNAIFLFEITKYILRFKPLLQAAGFGRRLYIGELKLFMKHFDDNLLN